MNDKKTKQNRREFLISSGRKTVLSGLGFIGISLGYKTLTSDRDTSCEVNLPCRNCFKLGNCNEDKAAEMRNEIKQSDQSSEKLNRKENG
jgi:hypothetical protein